MYSEFCSKHLRAFPPSETYLQPESVSYFGSLAGLLLQFEKRCDCRVVFVRAGGTLPDKDWMPFAIRTSSGKTVGHLLLMEDDFLKQETVSLLSSLADFLGDAYHWQNSVKEQEAILAVHGESVKLPRSIGSFANTLQSILRTLVRSIDCVAGSIYTIEDGSKKLKLRSVWGLPEDSLLSEPRLLSESLGDSEALLGQAVIANQPYLNKEWSVPEDFPSAVCVPIASSWATLGTLWLFSNQNERDFTENELKIIDIVAGRIALELTLRKRTSFAAAA